MKFYRYIKDTSGLYYSQYHRLTRIGLSKFWNELLIFDHFTVNFRTIFKFNVSRKLYLYVCICINSIKGIFMVSCNYSSSQKMKLNKVVDLRLTNYKAGNIRNGEYLRVLS